MRIKSLKDAARFLSEVKETSEKYLGKMDTPMYQGRTHFGYDDKNGFFIFSQGRNWCDQGRTYFSDRQFLSIAYKSRKEINRGGWESELY